jgi:hypothetical protein
MSKREGSRGFPLTGADQKAIVAVTIGVLVVTGFLVGLLF